MVIDNDSVRLYFILFFFIFCLDLLLFVMCIGVLICEFYIILVWPNNYFCMVLRISN